jgi:mannose-6-phosphate isomerase-like protein (cupin superfamily)
MYLNPKQFFNQNIFDIAIENAFYRKEIVTGPHSQVVIMCLEVGQEIGAEAHTVDQIFIFVQGRGQAIINDVVSEVKEHHLVFVPAGTKHNIKNMGSDFLRLITIYAPAEDAVGTLEERKGE